jgi:hypothetical protein
MPPMPNSPDAGSPPLRDTRAIDKTGLAPEDRLNLFLFFGAFVYGHVPPAA